MDASLLREIEAQGLLEGDELKMLIATIDRLAPGLSPLTRAALEGDRAGLAALFRNAVLQLDLSRLESPLQSGFFSRRLLAAELRSKGLPSAGVEMVSEKLSGALREVERAARAEIESQSKARLARKTGGLSDRNLATLSPGEVERMQSEVRKIAERLKTRALRKRRALRRGSLDVRRTLRRNLPWGGVPMVPEFRSRRPERPDVVVLCDVSDSVRNAARMMLLFTHTLQALFSRVRSFVFVSDIGEVTRHFQTLGPEQALDLASAGKVISLYGNSNYGRALSTFARDELGSITRRTTVMVIGDGRNNYNAPHVWALKDLRRKARRLLWICPEDERSWGFGDSEMHTYAKACHQVVVVRTIAELSRVADQLLPV
jgi:uncharacterized protein with von Willebrand factor type A (vWA) domain